MYFSFMPRSQIHRSPRRFHNGSNSTDDPGNYNFRSPIRMHNASNTTYDYGCNTKIYGLKRIVTDDAGSCPWLIMRQNRECVTWALQMILLMNVILPFRYPSTNTYPIMCIFPILNLNKLQIK